MTGKQQSKGYLKGCLQIFIVLAILGYFVEQCENSSCDVCGDYSFEYFENGSAFSDDDIADMVGEDKVDEYKNKLSSEPSMIYAVTIDRSEKLDDGGVRAEIMIGIGSPFYGDVTYKGKVVTTTGEETADGIIRIEYRYNFSLKEFEQITFGNDQNILFYDLESKGIRIRNGNSSEYGLSTLDGDLFLRE